VDGPTCWMCGGSGEVMGAEGEGRGLHVTFETCAFCHGRGWMREGTVLTRQGIEQGLRAARRARVLAGEPANAAVALAVGHVNAERAAELERAAAAARAEAEHAKTRDLELPQ
jgi:Ribonuclease G/E